MEYNLISVKGTSMFRGSLMDAIDAAIAMEEELQPSYGITIEDSDGNTVAEVVDGAIDGRAPDIWWEWHDSDSSRWSESESKAKQRCADWMIGVSNDGPEMED